MVSDALALATFAQKGADQGINEGTAILVAGVGGAVLAAVLQTLGAFLINYLAAKREERAAEREATKRHEQWEREDKLRREEHLQATQQRDQDRRAEAYRKFAAATAFAIPLDDNHRAEQLAKLTEAHTEVQAYGSPNVRDDATSLYDHAYRALYAEPGGNIDTIRRIVDAQRGGFWTSISEELEEEDQE